jgi:phage gp29-like protein
MGIWSWITGANRAPASSTPVGLLESALPDLPLSSQFRRIGGSLTPVAVSEILRAADSGMPAAFVDLVHECRQKDCHLQSVLGAAESDVTSLEWAIAPPKDATPAEEAAAEAFAAAWEAADVESGISHLVGESTVFGFAFVEVMWRLGDAGLLEPVELRPVSCRRFGFAQADGALRFDRYSRGSVDGPNGADLLEEHPAGKFVAVRRRVNGDVAPREGLGRCLVWAALGRNWTLRDWLTLGEIGWKPSRIGTYKKGADKADILHLARTIERFSSTGSATIPDSVSIAVEWPKGQAGATGGTHKELEDYLAAEMSKAVLHGTLTIESGSRGARSLGEVQQTGRVGVRDTNARVVTAALNRYIAAPFAAYNYGASVRPPRLVLITEDQVDLKSFGDALTALRAAGLRKIPAAWVRDQAGIPEALAGEETLDELNIPVTVEGEDDAEGDGADDDQPSEAA